MATNGTTKPQMEFLYHVKRTMTDFSEDKSGATQSTEISGTFTELAAAKAAARSALSSEGYVKDDFDTYEVKDESSTWGHEDGILAYATAPAGQVFEVGLDTNPNVLKYKGNAAGEVEASLHYVLQQTIDYSRDPTGASQVTEVQGTYPTREAACKAARTALLDKDITKNSFAEYDEFDDDRDINEWPYGEEVLVHAVAATGENFNIAVKEKLHSRQDPNYSHQKQV